MAHLQDFGHHRVSELRVALHREQAIRFGEYLISADRGGPETLHGQSRRVDYDVLVHLVEMLCVFRNYRLVGTIRGLRLVDVSTRMKHSGVGVAQRCGLGIRGAA